MNKLAKVIEQLKELSNGEIINVPLPDDNLLDDYEKEINFCFSKEYRMLLKEANNIFYGTIELLLVTKDKKYPSELSLVLNEAREQGLPENWLPICQDNGNYYCLIPDGTVHYWTLDGYSNNSWKDLADWIEQVWISGD
ncbi:SMI1/KNR4 family protein [Snodgrassella sp.]|uniref:SMI1/KNR4 family protein n=1 Tax=Snodgrassella sp. TaxID=2815304 RepID=UPI00258AC612|nr:SMI1/KNR4 family protein [Snodgrassella sp.]MCO6527149.1 SMI1/KNR4 family protein [Snodgrassella sp.]